tara:strand:- start:1699 stop:2088 length:390 start_codon:yes stop_codon:yes gene_type:complete
MAIVNHTIKLESADLTTDVISLTVLNTLNSAAQGGISRQKIIPTSVGARVSLVDEDLYTLGARVWLYNPSTATTNEKVYISIDGTTAQVVLSGGDWALIPWSASGNGTPVDIKVYAETTLNILEFGVFN